MLVIEKTTARKLTGLPPWEEPAVKDCLKNQCLPNGDRSCSVCHRSLNPEEEGRFVLCDRETNTYLFLFCTECNERPDKWVLVFRMAGVDEDALRGLLPTEETPTTAGGGQT